jgi:y4mF family transcriptional regulator
MADTIPVTGSTDATLRFSIQIDRVTSGIKFEAHAPNVEDAQRLIDHFWSRANEGATAGTLTIESPPRGRHPVPLEVGMKIRRAREAKKWTQADLAEHSPVSQSRISDIEQGKGSVEPEKLKALLAVLGLE